MSGQRVLIDMQGCDPLSGGKAVEEAYAAHRQGLWRLLGPNDVFNGLEDGIPACCVCALDPDAIAQVRHSTSTAQNTTKA